MYLNPHTTSSLQEIPAPSDELLVIHASLAQITNACNIDFGVLDWQGSDASAGASSDEASDELVDRLEPFA